MELDQIVPGAEYTYINPVPAGAMGHRYKVHRIIWDVPTYQEKVLVEALTGRDKGTWFCCSLNNFCVRYQPAEDLTGKAPARIGAMGYFDGSEIELEKIRGRPW